MSKEIAAGKEIDCYCTRCKLVLDHTIIAVVNGVPARVTCKTCHTDRNYRPVAKPGAKGDGAVRKPAGSGASGGSGSGASRPARAPAAPVVTAFQLEQAWLDLLGAARRSNAPERPFNLAETFNKDEILRHTKFGDGVVKAVDGNRMTVVFKDGERTLGHGRTA